MGRAKQNFDPEKYEEWRWVPDYEGLYGCTKCGTIFSSNNKGKDKIIKGSLDKDGYRRVQLFKDGKIKYVSVHRLVALVWICENSNDLIVCHNDGDKQNNHYKNLRYDTQRNNILDKKEHDTLIYGSKHHLTTLSEEDVKDIIKSEDTVSYIAKRYNVENSVIYQIKTGKSWKHLSRECLVYNKTEPETIEIKGITKTIKDWCTYYQINPSLFYSRRDRGWNVVDSLTKPKRG